MPAECKYQPVSLYPPLPEDLYDNCLYEDMAVNNSKRVTRKWEMFAGRNRFYCDGRLMTAPNSGVFLLTVCLITGTSTLFFVFDCQYLAENVTFAIPVVGGILYVFTMSALLRTSLSDPGIIPRATPDEAAYVEKQIEVTNSANSPTYRPPPRTKEVLVKGQTVKLKYCFTCKIFRPPRASHCSLCDNCVDRFDHHCPWVGNCVGRRNYRFFYMFIVSLAFLSVFIFACAIAHLILITKEDKQFLDAMKDSPASVLVAAVCFFSVWSILGLAGFHTYLTTSNQTTNEDIKGSFTSKRGQEGFNPYSQPNICLNCFHILCGPLTPSLIDRRGVVTDEYRLEVTHPIIITEPSISLKGYPLQQNGHTQLGSCEMPSLYRQTTENLDSNAGSVTHLVTSEAPLSVVPAVPEPLPQPDLTHSHVYNNVVSIQTPVTSPSVAYSQTVVNEKIDKAISKIEDLHLDTVVVLPGGEPRQQPEDSIKLTSVHSDNENNGLLSASRLRMLQDTTMIESALDLDSIDETSLGTGGQVGLMKVTV